MATSGEQAIGGTTVGTIQLGESVTWRARHFGIWFTMTSRVTSLDRPNRFVDEQIAGPFRSFHHEHVFTRSGAATVMIDTLKIQAPVFGRAAERLVLVPYLRRLIQKRNTHLLAALDALPTTDPDSPSWSPHVPYGFRRSEVTALIGRGDRVWDRATHDVLRWAVKTRSGFRVDDANEVARGDESTITASVVGMTISEPVRVATVVESPTRVGFSYRTRPGHPVTGEEAFIVHRSGEDVHLTIRSLTAPAQSQPWRALHPLLRIAQVVARRRYLRALRVPEPARGEGPSADLDRPH